jgi:hypothetical protein
VNDDYEVGEQWALSCRKGWARLFTALGAVMVFVVPFIVQVSIIPLWGAMFFAVGLVQYLMLHMDLMLRAIKKLGQGKVGP